MMHILNNKGVSLLEILISMFIFIVLMTLGINQLSVFREGSEFRDGKFRFEETVNLTRNLARNNVVSKSNSENPVNPSAGIDPFDLQVNAYFLKFEDNGLYNVYSCKLSGTDYDCSTYEPYVDHGGSHVEIENSNCNGILFKNLSGSIGIVQTANLVMSQAQYDNANLCEVTIKHIDDDSQTATYQFIKNDGNRFIQTS